MPRNAPEPRNDSPAEPEAERGERDRIAAIVRDPESVFLHWQLNGPRSREAISTLGEDCEWYLRVLNLSDGTSRTVGVDPEAGNFYVEVAPGQTYGFELAASSGERWRPVCRTDRVEIPPAEPGGPAEGGGSRVCRQRFGKLRPAAAKPVIAGLRYETTAPLLATSPGGAPVSEGGERPDEEG